TREQLSRSGSFFAVVKKRTRRMSRIENPREAIKDGSTGIFCLSITCQYGLLTLLTFQLIVNIHAGRTKKGHALY
ncbi:hypothetical protein, partial [Limosilactobacillus reuteri]|uniref:hypothetical protein n=1 Tax=Limosilactobacillus reuteri TaxID=1598 RepID=UPI001E3128DD